jgi:hypothetical protein
MTTGRLVSSIVEMVETAGAGVYVVVCSVVAVRVTGSEQPASTAVPATSVAPIVRRKRDVVFVIGVVPVVVWRGSRDSRRLIDTPDAAPRCSRGIQDFA